MNGSLSSRLFFVPRIAPILATSSTWPRNILLLHSHTLASHMGAFCCLTSTLSWPWVETSVVPRRLSPDVSCRPDHWICSLIISLKCHQVQSSAIPFLRGMCSSLLSLFFRVVSASFVAFLSDHPCPSRSHTSGYSGCLKQQELNKCHVAICC